MILLEKVRKIVMKIENGKKYLFNTSDSELKKYNGGKVNVVRNLEKDE